MCIHAELSIFNEIITTLSLLGRMEVQYSHDQCAVVPRVLPQQRENRGERVTTIMSRCWDHFGLTSVYTQ